MTDDIDIINAKIEMLKSEIFEYKLYVEICAITIIFVVATFFATQNGADQIRAGTNLSYLIILNTLILIGAVIYMFSRIIYLSSTSIRKVMNDKKEALLNWLK
jgi:hypothetical protein